MLTTILLSIGLAADAFAVSIAAGTTSKKIPQKNILKIALAFGGFQAVMPLIGYFIGDRFKTYIAPFDHWIIFVLLGFIGIKMISESLKKKREINIFKNKTLLIAAIATSLDALIAGVGFIFMDKNLFRVVFSIGLITFILSYIGTLLGKRISKTFLHGKAEIIGGIILCLIGTKTLITHLIEKI